MKKLITLFVALLCVISPFSFANQQKAASSADILRKINNQAGITVSGKYYKYEEPDFMKFYGTMPGVDMFVSAANNKWYFAYNFLCHIGKTDYDGGLQNAALGTKEPYFSKNDDLSIINI